MLIPFPFAFLTGGWGFGVAAALTGRDELKTVARYLVPTGVAAGLELNQMKLLHAGERRVVVARTEDGDAAFDDRCTHKGGPLSDGVLICGTVQCPWHGSQFDVHTGEVKCGPAEKKIETYEVEPARRSA